MRARSANVALQQLEKVRLELNSAKDPLADDTHETRKRFCGLIEDVLLKDLELALTKKLEQDLWNVGYRMAITTIQKEEPGKERTVRLSQIMDLSSSYFLRLLQRVVFRYKVTELKIVPGPDCQGVLDFMESSEEAEEIRITKRSHIHYICQYCLIHIGDVSRYRNERRLAEAYYSQASTIDPRNGHPYNQLGLLEGARGANLATIFFYVRSLSVGRPFVVAISNLEKIYAKIIQEEKSDSTREKKASSDYISMFLQLTAYIHMKQRLDEAEELLKGMSDFLPRLILNKKIDDFDLLMITTIALFTFNRSSRDAKSGGSALDESILKMMSSFVFGIFRTMLLVNIEAEGQLAMPCIILLLETLIANPTSIALNPFKDVWFVLRTVLNAQSETAMEWSTQALPEDYKLQGFLPLRHVHSKINFAENKEYASELCDLRKSRFRKLGIELCKLKCVFDARIITFRDEAFHAESTIDEDDLVKELKLLKIDKEQKSAVRFENQPKVVSLEDVPRPTVVMPMNQRPHIPHHDLSVRRLPVPFSQIPPPPLPLNRWNMIPPPGPMPMMRPGHPPMNIPIDELVKQPPPPIYNIERGHVRPAPPITLPFPQQMPLPQQTNTYSLFNQANTWNTPMVHPSAIGHGMPILNPTSPIGNFVHPNGFTPARPQSGSLWKPDKSPQGTSALERLLKESRRNVKES